MVSGNKSLAEFLKDHGLEHYVGLLEKHAVDLEVLPHLSFDELKELGLPLGDRRRLLLASNGLAPGRTPQARVAERRHVTVLFCDVVGSTELAHRLDPEDFTEVLRTYADRTAAAIHRFHGHVAKFMGDGVLAFFGYPNAHEDDVERAILAALEIQRIHRETNIEIEGGGVEKVQVRIGIHTGKVVAGNFASGSGPEDDIFGETPNIAQRLLSEATPEEIIVSPQTRRLAGNRFEYGVLEPRVLNGLAEPIRPYRVLREYAERTRFETRKSWTLTPLVGRGHDIEMLVEHWSAVKARQGQAVLLSGPAGIGKSRLINAFVDEIRADPKRIVTLQCSPHHTGTALYPVVTWLSQEVGLSGLDDRQSRFEALQRWLDGTGLRGERNLALLAALLSVDTDQFLPPLDMTPRQRMEETLLFLSDHVTRLAERLPVLALIEDVHWADPTTLRLLEMAQQPGRDRAIMMLATFRSDTDHGAPEMSIAVQYRLNRLTQTDMTDLVVQAARPHNIDERTVLAIVQRSQGIPLFAEELTKAVIERQNNGTSEDESQAGEIFVPDSLVDSLSARLDALPNGKHLAQIAAAIGREVPQELLMDVSGYGEAKFQAALRDLADAQMIVAYPESGSDPLVFGHALIQDVAYNLMLRRDRRAIHARIAEALEIGSRDGHAPLPEILARHHEAARQMEKAAHYLIKAGRNAIAQSANMEALRHLEHAREIVTEGTGISEAKALHLELAIQSAIGAPLIAVKGYTSRDTLRAFDRAAEIADNIGDVQNRFHALFGLWGHRWMAGHLDMSRRIASEMLEIAEKHPTLERRILADRCAGSSQWILGNCAAALGHLDEVIRLSRDIDTAELAGKYAVCPHVVALVLGGYGQWLDGAREEGFNRLKRGFDRAHQMNHPYSMALSHSMMGGIAWLKRDEEMLAEHVAALRTIAEERRFPFWQVYAQCLEGALLGLQGDCMKAKELVELAIDAYDGMGVYIHRTMQLIMLSDIEWRLGHPRRATGLLEEAEALGNRTGERQWFGVIAQMRSADARDGADTN